MFKKIIICFALLHLTFQMNAQFFRGFGFFVGPTTSSHRYKNLNPIDNSTFAHAIPAPSHRSGEFVYFSVGILGEFLKYDHDQEALVERVKELVIGKPVSHFLHEGKYGNTWNLAGIGG